MTMRFRHALVVVLASSTLLGPANAAYGGAPPPPAPAEFGTDWDDPRTAAPPVARPPGRSCTVQIVDDRFDDFTPYRGSYLPPRDCAGPWQKVVLRLEGAVAGRQYDRLGHLDIGGVTIFKTSTPEPSVAGIRWSVEKDVTGYAPLLTRAQPVEMLIGNVVDGTYTGVLDVQVYLTFYPGKAAATPSDVLALTQPRREGTSVVGELTVPANTERLVAEVYATGSGGGCEEFWYLTTPAAAPYSCPADVGPYREVQVRVDGTLAGVAAPYPHVYTGGWSNPFLWYVLPAPRAFDIQPIRYDLTPFVGRLTDGRAHRIEVSVLGVPRDRPGWDLPTTVLAWRDAGRTRVTGDLRTHRVHPPKNRSTYTAGDPHQVVTEAGHGLTVGGYLDTSRGRVYTTVDRRLGNTSRHRWTDGEAMDSLVGTWTDDEVVTTVGARRPPALTRTARRYTMDGRLTVGGDNRVSTVISLGDEATTWRPGGPVRLSDTYRGAASWTLGVPREERHAVGTSWQRYRLLEAGRCYDRTLATTNGYLTTDRYRCR